VTAARRGSHAPALRTIVRETLAVEAKLAPGSHVLCAVSGGPDSIAMMHVLASLRGPLGILISAHAVDHGLRADAASEIDVARAVARDIEVPFDVSSLRVEPGGNLMARARTARYDALRKAALRGRADVIATGHTADDRAETVLMRILRGTTVRGLGVLAVRSKDLLRPIVRARRADVAIHLARHRLPSAVDPSNLDGRFLRVRVRHELLPLLEALGPKVVNHLVDLADEAHTARLGHLDPLSALGRRQRDQVLRAFARGAKEARVRVTDDEEVLVSLASGRLVITQVPSSRGR
jgi:tRNA(Ile)-lysidine synthase